MNKEILMIKGIREMENMESIEDIRNERFFMCFDGVCIDINKFSDKEIMLYINVLKQSRDVNYIIYEDIDMIRFDFSKAIKLQMNAFDGLDDESVSKAIEQCKVVLKAFKVLGDDELRIMLFNFAKRNMSEVYKTLTKVKNK